MARRAPIGDPTLNLIPILNMVSLLIPVLLMAAQFVALGVIDSTLPSIGTPKDASQSPEEAAKPLLLSVKITGAGFSVHGADAALGVAPGAGRSVPCPSQPCGSATAYDYAELRRVLNLVKDQHPTERTVIVAPEARVPYEVLVRVMDTSREDPSRPNAEGQPRELFPTVVIAGGAS